MRLSLLSCFVCLLSFLLPGQSLYHTYGDLLHFFLHAAKLNPTRLRFEDVKLPRSTSLPIATLTNFSRVGGKRVAVLVFGEHAREVITTEVAFWLIKVLVGDLQEIEAWPELGRALEAAGLRNTSASQALQKLARSILDRLIVKVLPIENMDGRLLWEGGDLCRRKTASGVDLNRNWEVAWKQQNSNSDEYGGRAAFSEPQSRYLRDQAASWKPLAFVNVHSGEWAVYTPWDSRTSLGAGLPTDLTGLMSSLSSMCDCMAGPAGAVSNYLAFGTSMDYMHVKLAVPYPLTVEVYGIGGEGKLKGRTNPSLSTFKVTAARRSRPRLMLNEGSKDPDPILKLVKGSSQENVACFNMFNPQAESEYREVISRWVVMLMVILDHAASSADKGVT